MELMNIRLNRITIPDGQRALRGVDELAESIRELGVNDPISVVLMPDQKGFQLVAGHHRLKAVELLGWKDIPAIVHKYDTLDAKIAALDSNLCRNAGNELERDEWIAQRKALYLVKYPETRQGAAGAKAVARGASGKFTATAPSATAAPSFVKDTAKKTGYAERTIREAVQIGNLPDPVRAAVRSTPIADKKNELKDLARLAPELQLPVAKQIEAGAATVAQALAAVQSHELPRAADPDPVRPSSSADPRLSQILAWRDQGGNQSDIARVMGMPPTAVSDLLKKVPRADGRIAMRPTQERLVTELAGRLEGLSIENQRLIPELMDANTRQALVEAWKKINGTIGATARKVAANGKS